MRCDTASNRTCGTTESTASCAFPCLTPCLLAKTLRPKPHRTSIVRRLRSAVVPSVVRQATQGAKYAVNMRLRLTGSRPEWLNARKRFLLALSLFQIVMSFNAHCLTVRYVNNNIRILDMETTTTAKSLRFKLYCFAPFR